MSLNAMQKKTRKKLRVYATFWTMSLVVELLLAQVLVFSLKTVARNL